MNEHDNPNPDDPLLAALASLREIDADYVQAHPAIADDELQRRMTDLWLTVTVRAELQERGEDAEPDAVRVEMERLGEKFAFDPNLLIELEADFREAGDDANADTLQRAIAWVAAKLPPQG